MTIAPEGASEQELRQVFAGARDACARWFQQASATTQGASITDRDLQRLAQDLADAPEIRERICADMDWLGIAVDPPTNTPTASATTGCSKYGDTQAANTIITMFRMTDVNAGNANC